MAIATLAGGSAGMDLACTQSPSRPPPIGDDDAQLHVGDNTVGGGGSENEASMNECVAAGGVCMNPGIGNLCPEQSSDSCGTTPETETMVCCTGFNDAGAPDAVPDVLDN